MILEALSILLMISNPSTVKCEFQIDQASKSATIAVSNKLKTEVPILSLNAKMKSCKRHDAYKDLYLAEVMVGEAGTSSISKVIKLFVLQTKNDRLELVTEYPIGAEAVSPGDSSGNYYESYDVTKNPEGNVQILIQKKSIKKQ